MQSLVLDLRYALRSLAARPGFVIAAVLTLGLGIGATTAIFSVVNGVLLRALPYPSPRQLVALSSNASYPDLEDLRSWSTSFSGVGGAVVQPLDLVGGPEPVQVQVVCVTGDLFHTLGVRPERGRGLEPSDDRQGGPQVVVLSHTFWKQRLEGDPLVLGRSLTLSGKSYTVVGVMPPRFEVPQRAGELYAPLNVVLAKAAPFRGVHFLRTVWRLKPGITMAHAQQELTRLGVRLGEENPTESRGRAWELVPLHDTLVGNVRTALWILLGAVGIVLLVACSNFANLLLARSASRSHEIAIRSSLGAGRSRLVRQFLTESVVLALLGGALGTLLASWGVDLLLALQPNVLPRLGDIRVDAIVLGFAIAVAILTGLAFGAIPALHVTRAMPADTLQRAGSTTLGGREHRVLDAMVVAQVALAIVLLVGAGLLMHGLWKLYSVPPGFDPANVLTMRLELPEARYDSVLTQNQYRGAVFGALRAVPGIQAGMVSELPLAGDALTHNFIIEGRAPIPPGEEPELMSRSVAGDYFQVMRIPVLQGRGLTADDRQDAPRVGVINESMVRTYFPDGHPIGQHVRWAHADPSQWIEIVGVVPDIRHFGLSEPEQPAIYTPYAQFQDNWKRWMCVVVSGPGVTTSGMAERVKERIWTVDPQIPITQLKPMTDVIASSLADRRFNLTLIGIFAAVALVLASLGIASVASYVTARRTREIGLRLALGADRRDVMALVLGRSLRQVALGTVLGVAGALMLTGLMRSMLYQVSAHDPVTYVAVAAALGLAALVASMVPALRATRVDPVITLRSE